MTLDALRRERDDVRVVGRGSQLQGLVRPCGVVVLGEDPPDLLLVVDQDPIGALGANAAHGCLGVGVVNRAWSGRGSEINDLTARITTAIAVCAPRLLDRYCVGPDTAATLLIAAGDNLDRMGSRGPPQVEAAKAPVGEHKHALRQRGEQPLGQGGLVDLEWSDLGREHGMGAALGQGRHPRLRIRTASPVLA
ncbi:hypothetical protein ACFCYB_35285 [Streptomyces sp. NPDC056309]|uniref:hypothetical protein n=1 Tax=unclassified Streptomyces TaxID=2593676 RepID=UPI0035D6F56F